MWDVGTAACLATAAVEDEDEDDAMCTGSMCVLADGRVASGGDDGLLRIWAWDAASKSLSQQGEPLRGHERGVYCIVPVGAGAAQQLLSGSDDSTLRLWGRDGRGAWAEAAVLRGHRGAVRSIAVVRARVPGLNPVSIRSQPGTVSTRSQSGLNPVSARSQPGFDMVSTRPR